MRELKNIHLDEQNTLKKVQLDTTSGIIQTTIATQKC